ncbi:hypothetical protein DFJ73DRAFT_819979 [Zopfochytrium polystomum]|nr:hypothetical protein DFJ73DRAFT_819979 [Zopfochytrium polystomum]
MVAVAARDAFYCPGCRSSAARRRAEAGPAPSEDPQRVRLAEEETASVGGFGAVGRSAERLAPAVANLCLGSDNNDGRNVDPASTSKGTTAESTNPAEGPSMQDRDDSEDNDGGDSATAVTASSGWSRIVAGEIHADSGYDVGTNGAGGLVQPAVKGCGHRCLMRHSPECCLCGDVRPQAERYWVFILRDEFDSLRTEAEVVETVDRTALYCTECRAAGEV